MNYNSTYYMIVDKEGKVVKESTELEGVRLLTDEDPVYTEGAVMWVNTQNGFVNI